MLNIDVFYPYFCNTQCDGCILSLNVFNYCTVVWILDLHLREKNCINFQSNTAVSNNRMCPEMSICLQTALFQATHTSFCGLRTQISKKNCGTSLLAHCMLLRNGIESGL